MIHVQSSINDGPSPKRIRLAKFGRHFQNSILIQRVSSQARFEHAANSLMHEIFSLVAGGAMVGLALAAQLGAGEGR